MTVVFGAVYWFLGQQWKIGPLPGAGSTNFAMAVVDSKCKPPPALSWWDYLYFSALNVAPLPYAAMYPSALMVQLLTYAQSVLLTGGLITIALAVLLGGAAGEGDATSVGAANARRSPTAVTALPWSV